MYSKNLFKLAVATTVFTSFIALSGCASKPEVVVTAVSYTHFRAHETVLDLVCRLLLEKQK